MHIDKKTLKIAFIISSLVFVTFFSCVVLAEEDEWDDYDIRWEQNYGSGRTKPIDHGSIYSFYDVVKAYQKSINQSSYNSKKDPNGFVNDEIILMGLGEPGFCLKDIDGIPGDELLIGRYGEGNIFRIYTIRNGALTRILNGWDRCRFFLTTEGYIVEEGSGGAGYFDHCIYTFNESGYLTFVENLATREFDGMDYIADKLSPYHLLQAEDEECTDENRVTVSFGEDWTNSITAQYTEIEYTSLKAMLKELQPFSITVGKKAIVSVDGKTTGSATVNLRKSASKKAKIVTKLKVGTSVDVLDVVDDYYLVSYGHKQGYIHKEYLTAE